ncbi:MAG: hypothetical protein QUS08_09355, partial [Methanothrix sp.]|nr:hypothetical protein [Methanothrix sp.]
AGRAIEALCLLSIPGMVILASFGEWMASALSASVAALCYLAWRSGKGEALLISLGPAGFPIGQAAMTFLPYGWKTWSVSGVLFVLCGALLLSRRHLQRLPLLSGDRSSRRAGRLIYSLAALLLSSVAIAALIHVPSTGPEGKTSGSESTCLCDFDCPEGSETASGSSTGARILSPGDVRTFQRGEDIGFQAEARGRGPLQIIWRSSLDGVIGRSLIFNTSSLSQGWHKITLTVTDVDNSTAEDYIEIGVADPQVCGRVSPRPLYYPPDTPCQETWPNATRACQEFEVCHPGLDYIVSEAVDCCDGTPSPVPACAYACSLSGGDKKRCRGLYIIRSLGPDALYMRGYALFKACCSGYPECTRTCLLNLSGTCAFREGFNEDVWNISCRPGDWGVSAWRSDTNMSENSAVLGISPTHATVNILQTGVCIDYAAALTTLLRKAGYNRTEVLSTHSTGYDLPILGGHPGHAYNLVLLPGEAGYHIVDTTGNGEGINPGGVPHYFLFDGCFAGMPVRIRAFDWWVEYCKRTASRSYNDAGLQPTPGPVLGCQGSSGQTSGVGGNLYVWLIAMLQGSDAKLWMGQP